ncbi:MAG TPA: glycosyltransferase [Actinomycetota bacterium]|nr:glycosyltransferase [Actinomycetota bacterium]
MTMRVLITSPAMLGHIHPMVPLARAIAERGHDVRWALPADGVGEVERRGIRAVAAAPSLPIGPALAKQRYPELNDLPPADVPAVMFGKLWGAIAAPEMLHGLVPLTLAWRPHLVITDAAEFAGHIVAAEVGVPSVTKGFGPLLPASRVASAAREVAHLWRSRGLEPRPFGGAYDTLYLDSYPPVLQPQPAEHIAHRQLVRPHRDDGEFDSSAALPFPEGPAGTPLVYVTMGTVFNDVNPLRVTIGALRDLPVRILVTVGPGGDPAMLGEQPTHVRVERYVPQSAVLGHCDVVVSHGGSGTALGALALGLPQLCLPQGADQFLNAAAIASAGAGLAILPGEFTPEAVTDAVERLLSDHSFRDAAARVRASIAAMPPVEEVAAFLETLTQVPGPG